MYSQWRRHLKLLCDHRQSEGAGELFPRCFRFHDRTQDSMSFDTVAPNCTNTGKHMISVYIAISSSSESVKFQVNFILRAAAVCKREAEEEKYSISCLY